jgi:hypothetical protein
MEKIKTKRHFIYFYLLTGIVSFVFLGFGAKAVYWSYNIHLIQSLTDEAYLAIIVSPVLFFLGFYTIIRVTRNVPIIRANKLSIKFNREEFYWNDLVKSELTGKKEFKYLTGLKIEGTTLYFKNGQSKTFYDSGYSNTWLLKSFIHEVILNNKTGPILAFPPITTEALQNENFKAYKGSFLLSFRGILMLGTIIFSGWLLAIDSPSFKAYFLIFGTFSVVIIFLHSFLTNYLAVSDNYLLVKNQLLFWKKKSYRLNDILEIFLLESSGQLPRSLMIVTKDFKRKKIYASTLNDKDWLALRDKLVLNGF